MAKHLAWTLGYYEDMYLNARANFEELAHMERNAAIQNADARGAAKYYPIPGEKRMTQQQMEESAQRAGDIYLDIYLHSYEIAKLPYEDQRKNRIALGHARYLHKARSYIEKYETTKDPEYISWALCVIDACANLYKELSPDLEQVCNMAQSLVNKQLHDELLVDILPEVADWTSEIEADLDESDGKLSRFIV